MADAWFAIGLEWLGAIEELRRAAWLSSFDWSSSRIGGRTNRPKMVFRCPASARENNKSASCIEKKSERRTVPRIPNNPIAMWIPMELEQVRRQGREAVFQVSRVDLVRQIADLVPLTAGSFAEQDVPFRVLVPAVECQQGPERLSTHR